MKGVDQTFDLTVIGSGVTGLAAALFAAQSGIRTLLMGGSGQSDFSSGLIDLMGVHPVSQGTRWENPWAAIEALRRNDPRHPYALLDAGLIRRALTTFLSFTAETGLPYRWKQGQNTPVPTAMGTIKHTFGVPAGMWAGTTVTQSREPLLIVDFEGLKGFTARQIASLLGTIRPGVRSLRVPNPLGASVRELLPGHLAAGFESPDARARLADLIKPRLDGAARVGLPAVIGLHRHEEAMMELTDRIGAAVFEIPGTWPSIPALRFQRALTGRLAEMDVVLMRSNRVFGARADGADGFVLHTGNGAARTRILTRGVILATGRFLGGGLSSDRSGIRESVFDLPLFMPEDREGWHRRSFLDARGHPLNRAGIIVDEAMQPLNKRQQPVYPGLFAAGTILAHQDWKREKCGTGLSIATAFQAVRSFRLWGRLP